MPAAPSRRIPVPSTSDPARTRTSARPASIASWRCKTNRRCLGAEPQVSGGIERAPGDAHRRVGNGRTHRLVPDPADRTRPVETREKPDARFRILHRNISVVGHRQVRPGEIGERCDVGAARQGRGGLECHQFVVGARPKIRERQDQALPVEIDQAQLDAPIVRSHERRAGGNADRRSGGARFRSRYRPPGTAVSPVPEESPSLAPATPLKALAGTVSKRNRTGWDGMAVGSRDDRQAQGRAAVRVKAGRARTGLLSAGRT